MPEAVLFDLDGTLVDSLPELHEGVARTARELGLREPDPSVTARMIGKGIKVLGERLAAWWREGEALPEGVDATTIVERLSANWCAMTGERVRPFPGAFEGVRALRRAGIRTALVTNKIRPLTEAFLASRGLADAFDAVLTGSDVERLKPEPDMLLSALKQLGVSPEKAIMVGDSAYDALAGRRAGVRVCLLECGYNEGVPMKPWAAENGFDEVDADAAALVERLLKEDRQ